MLERSRGLTATDLQALAALEHSAVAADGGRLKLEWTVLRSRSGDRVDDLLWWEDGRLLGFVGLYRFGSAVELAGVVEPAVRRRGIGTALLTAAAALVASRGLSERVLVVPAGSVAGGEFARKFGGALDHSEHALLLTGPPVAGPSDPRTTLRRAELADAPPVRRLLAAAFDYPQNNLAESLVHPTQRTLLAEVDGVAVGTVRLTLVGDVGSIHGFAVDPHRQGQGIGRDVLRRVCTQLFAAGARRVELEVAVENARALGLYTALGFAPFAGEDYYTVPLA